MHNRVLASALVAVLWGCAGAGEHDYDRHRLSTIGISPTDPGVYLYEARIDPKYPGGSAAAEAIRMDWLNDWMERGRYCTDGYEIVERRTFEPDESNPYDSDLRYIVKCLPAAEA